MQNIHMQQICIRDSQWLVTANADVTVTAVVLQKVLATVVSKGLIAEVWI